LSSLSDGRSIPISCTRSVVDSDSDSDDADVDVGGSTEGGVGVSTPTRRLAASVDDDVDVPWSFAVPADTSTLLSELPTMAPPPPGGGDGVTNAAGCGDRLRDSRGL